MRSLRPTQDQSFTEGKVTTREWRQDSNPHLYNSNSQGLSSVVSDAHVQDLFVI